MDKSPRDTAVSTQQKGMVRYMENNPLSKQDISAFYDVFCRATIKELENAILSANEPEERAFYRKLLNLKLQTEQEKIVGERLV